MPTYAYLISFIQQHCSAIRAIFWLRLLSITTKLPGFLQFVDFEMQIGLYILCNLYILADIKKAKMWSYQAWNEAYFAPFSSLHSNVEEKSVGENQRISVTPPISLCARSWSQSPSCFVLGRGGWGTCRMLTRASEPPSKRELPCFAQKLITSTRSLLELLL